MQATFTASSPASSARQLRRLRRFHPLLIATTLAVAVAAAGVAGAAAWRQRSEARHAELSEWRMLASAASDAQALARLKAAANGGEIAAMSALGEALLSRNDASGKQEGERWLRSAADAGSVRAHFLLGKGAMLGSLNAGQADLPGAWQHLTSAAEGGDVGAAYYLGLLYRGGYGRTPDTAQAVRWFTVAAEGGVAQAMFMLANAYREGAGVPRDNARAVAWYEAAAEREHPASIQALAMAYRYGELGLGRDDGNFRAHLAEAAHALKHPAINP